MRVAGRILRFLSKRRGTTVVLSALALAGLVEAGVVLAGGSSTRTGQPVALAPVQRAPPRAAARQPGVIVGHSYRSDVSPALRRIEPAPLRLAGEMEASPNPRPESDHADKPDTVVQREAFPSAMPSASLNFDGIAFPGFDCNCWPPDPNGEVGATQYVQLVNTGLQVFDKATGASLLGPEGIATLWTGFGGVCETNGAGDPVVLYDQLANRWVITQFAGTSVPTDECIAISTSSDATGTFTRYAFHLGNDFFDYPHLGMWPDAYYMSMNVYNTGGTDVPRPGAVRLRPRGDAGRRSRRHVRHSRATRRSSRVTAIRSCRATSTARARRPPAPRTRS